MFIDNAFALDFYIFVSSICAESKTRTRTKNQRKCWRQQQQQQR